MSTRTKKIILYSILFLLALFYDVLLGTARLPIVTLVLCGIVQVYERVSPLIYSSR